MRRIALALGLTVLLCVPAVAALARQHSHPAPAPAASASATPAHRYVTDATLREQMRGIHGEVLALDRHAHGDLTSTVAGQAADRITAHVNTIITECKLPPDADAALHHIIGSLLQDAAALKADPGQRDAIAGMQRALGRYAQQFDDPGFPDSPVR